MSFLFMNNSYVRKEGGDGKNPLNYCMGGEAHLTIAFSGSPYFTTEGV